MNDTFKNTISYDKTVPVLKPPITLGGETLLVESLMGQQFDSYLEDIRDLFMTDASPAQGSAIAQDVLEPVLRARAEQLSGDLRFGTELVTFEQDEDGITATICERASGNMRSVRAQFLVAADGGHSAIRQQLGIGTRGAGSLFHCISMIFEADLMKLFRKRNAIMCFLSNEQIASGALVPYPGSAARPDLFRLDVGYNPEEETLADYPEARCLSLIRAAVGIPDLPVQLKTVLNYEAVELVADRFQQGRVFLVGDAARTQPPSGGLGGNTGIAEAHNLAWKLAVVLRGEAGEGLLATYDAERRPLADYTAEQVALLSQQRQTEGSAGITVDLVMLNAGYRYSAGAIAREEGDENLPLAQHPDRWKGQPGTHAPHLVLERHGEQISTLDLFGREWVLLLGSDGHAWQEAAQRAAERLSLSLNIYRIGSDLVDVNGSFYAAYGITPASAVLVRPDSFIAWRSEHQEKEPELAIEQALSSLLFR